MKVLLRAPFSTFSGYGNDGIGMARALLRWGVDLYIDPTNIQAPLPADVAMLLTKRHEAPFDLTIVHVDPASFKLTEFERSATDMAVGWTMWEYTNLGNMPGRSNLRKNLKYFDALVGYDPVSSACLEEYTRKDQPVLTVQGGFWPEDWQYAERDWFGDRFGFCMVGALHLRKDPFVAIQAFNELKLDPDIEFDGAELHLKTNVQGLHRAMEEVIPKLRIHYAVWPNEVLREFYAAQHVLLAPSRGEGKNMPALEMQSTGGAVIATNWGGHQQWLNKEYAYPLDYVLASEAGFPNTQSARASVEHMKELMLHAYQNRAEVKQKGELASKIIPQIASWDAVIERFFRSIKENVEGGELLWTKAQLAKRDAHA